MPHVHPSGCRGVLWMWVSGVSRRKSGGAIVVPSTIDGGCYVSCLWPGVAGG